MTCCPALNRQHLNPKTIRIKHPAPPVRAAKPFNHILQDRPLLGAVFVGLPGLPWGHLYGRRFLPPAALLAPRTIEEAISDLTEKVEQLPPAHPRVNQLAEMIRGLRKYEMGRRRSTRNSCTPPASQATASNVRSRKSPAWGTQRQGGSGHPAREAARGCYLRRACFLSREAARRERGVTFGPPGRCCDGTQSAKHPARRSGRAGLCLQSTGRSPPFDLVIDRLV